MRNGKLSKREMATLDRALEILSSWAEHQEETGNDGTYEYDNATAAVVGLGEFLSAINGVELPTVEM